MMYYKHKIFVLHRMDKDGSLEITFNEWRDFLLYAPSTNIHELIVYWRHSTVSSLFAFFLIYIDFLISVILIVYYNNIHFKKSIKIFYTYIAC